MNVLSFNRAPSKQNKCTFVNDLKCAHTCREQIWKKFDPLIFILRYLLRHWQVNQSSVNPDCEHAFEWVHNKRLMN